MPGRNHSAVYKVLLALSVLLVGANPVLAYVGLGMLWLWERGWVACTVAAVVWLLSGGIFSILAARWTKTERPILPPLDWESPHLFAPLDRDAWKLVQEEAEKGETLAYDVSLPAEPQLAGLAAAPTHAYYFATPTIFRAQSAQFARARLDAFLNVYVEGFLNLAEALRARRKDVSLFYSSSVFVAERPRGMLEYAMAKAAGETLVPR